MENDERSVFERLDSVENKVGSIDSKIDDILKIYAQAISTANKETPKVGAFGVDAKQADEKTLLSVFVKRARKEYLWFGPSKEFQKSKSLLCLSAFATVSLSLLPTVCTSIAIGFYSPFSVFQNIWMIFSIVALTYALNFKERMSDSDLKDHSLENYQQDRDGTWRPISNKKSFIWFRRFSNISCLMNIVMMWCLNQGAMSIVATIFEILLLGVTLAFLFAYANLTSMYGNFILYTSKSDAGDDVTLVFDVMGKKLLTYEDFSKKFGKAFAAQSMP